jgi:hypothetical protein
MARVKGLLEPEWRFWSRVRIREGCWVWVGCRDQFGYGQISIDNVRVRVHRVSYTWLVGPVPEGLELDHLCRNPSCCNPKHLEPVTHQENMIRGNAGKWQRDKTHCKHGHRFTEDNIMPTGKGGVFRRCRACYLIHIETRKESRKISDKKYYNKNKERIRKQQKEYQKRMGG